MWKTLSEWLVGLTALISAPFISEPPIQAVNEPIVVEAPAEVVPVEPVVETVAPVEPPKEEPIQVTLPAPAPTPDQYCAKYASKYSQAEYDKQKEKPGEMKDGCKSDNKARADKAESDSKVRQTDCEEVYNDTYEKFKSWEEQYDQFHSRC